MFIKQFASGRGDFRSPSGDKIQPKYGMKFDLDQKKEIPAIVGEQPWYDMIQSYKEGTELKSVIAMIKNGSIPQSQIDNYIGQLKEDSFIDVSGLPSSFVEVSALNTKLKETYNSLPADIKSLFGNDIARMSGAVLDGSFNKVLTDHFVALKSSRIKSSENKESNNASE